MKDKLINLYCRIYDYLYPKWEIAKMRFFSKETIIVFAVIAGFICFQFFVLSSTSNEKNTRNKPDSEKSNLNVSDDVINNINDLSPEDKAKLKEKYGKDIEKYAKEAINDYIDDSLNIPHKKNN